MSLNLANVDDVYATNKEVNRIDVMKIFEWLQEQPNLPQITELQVTLFLHSCYDVEATKTTIKKYFTVRTQNPEIFGCADPETIKGVLSVLVLSVLPKQTSDGNIVLIIKFLDTNPKNYHYTNMIKVLLMLVTLYLHQHGPVNGLVTLVDCTGVTFGHLFRVNFTVLKHVANYFQEAAPIQLRNTHFINSMPIINRIMSFIKPFFKKEVYEMNKFHSGSLESFYKYIPKECLPEDYGGDLPSLESLNARSMENLLTNLEFFKWHDSQKVDKKEVQK